MYCLDMLTIAVELGQENPAYQDLATKFFEHFVYIGAAVNRLGGERPGLWNEQQGFYCDALKLPDGRRFPIAAHTIAGLIPIFAITSFDRNSMRAFPGFDDRYGWFAKYRPHLLQGLADLTPHGLEQRLRFALVDSDKLRRLIEHMLREDDLLSPFGVRSLSKQHAASPFVLEFDGQRFELDYQPGESTSTMFGGNSNWRGPVWFPLNFLLIEALQKHHHFLGDGFKVQLPTGTGHEATLWQVSTDLSLRLISIFLKDANGRRPVNGRREKFHHDPHWRDLILFHEYFHGDSWRRPGRESSDRMGRGGREADPAVLRVPATGKGALTAARACRGDAVGAMDQRCASEATRSVWRCLEKELSGARLMPATTFCTVSVTQFSSLGEMTYEPLSARRWQTCSAAELMRSYITATSPGRSKFRSPRCTTARPWPTSIEESAA